MATKKCPLCGNELIELKKLNKKLNIPYNLITDDISISKNWIYKKCNKEWHEIKHIKHSVNVFVWILAISIIMFLGLLYYLFL